MTDNNNFTVKRKVCDPSISRVHIASAKDPSVVIAPNHDCELVAMRYRGIRAQSGEATPRKSSEGQKGGKHRGGVAVVGRITEGNMPKKS